VWQSLFQIGRESARRFLPVLGCVCLIAASLPCAADPPPPESNSTSKSNQHSPQDDPVADTASLPKPIRSVEGISQYELDNGVQILLFPDESKEVVTVNMTVFVGSRHEG